MKRLFFCLLLTVSISKINYCKAQVLAQDSLALVDFYNSVGDGELSNTWLQGPISTWEGVITDGSRVYGLSLPFYNLVGSIPQSFGNLTALQTLNLATNQLGGTIYPSIGNLTQLTYLNLTGNNFSNNFLSYLSTDTSLQDLELASAFYYAGGTIPSSLANLTHLNTLNLSGNSLSGPLPSFISNFTNLISLVLDGNQLTGRIPPSIGNLTKLTYLDLGANKLSDSIPFSIGNLTKLTYLGLYDNQLNFNIPSSVGNLINLTRLDLNTNQLTGDIPSSISNLNNAGYVDLSYNQLSGTIPYTSIANLGNATFVNLSNNQFTGSLSFSSFTNFTKHVAFSFAHNKLTGTIPSSLSSLTNVTSLQLSYNQLTGALPVAVSADLEYLNVDHNLLFGPVPVSLSSVNTLGGVTIDDNQFTFDGMEQFAQAPYKAAPVYAPQANIPIQLKNNILSVSAGGTLANNIYKWLNGAQVVIIKYGDSTYKPLQAGNYTVQVTNNIATSLTLNGNSIAVNAVGSDVCASGSQIISNVTGSTYQWKVNTGNGFISINDNSNYAGTHTDTLNFINIPSAWYGYQYQCLVDNASTSSVYSIQFVNTWTGADNNSIWEDPDNWSCGSVPDTNTDVIINNGTVVLSSNATIRSLTVNPAASFTVMSPYILTVNH